LHYEISKGALHIQLLTLKLSSRFGFLTFRDPSSLVAALGNPCKEFLDGKQLELRHAVRRSLSTSARQDPPETKRITNNNIVIETNNNNKLDEVCSIRRHF
jgi:hypothetical protein